MVRYYIIVDGRVQGVGFRFFCTMNARTLDLTGWVRNMNNGMVEMEVQGEESSIEKFIRNIKKGNKFIRVDELSQKKIKLLSEERTFTERY
ncbi:acylphosphatase [Clostridium sp.]|uniref:acylphosphatase n=1 Tax=Clostridium sp. TaxID=1506 RepID=UPI0025BFEA63|nr:acylphosphatase [Clostridium sp.]MCI9070909.1 acylphosphatase [Clostridium sp.]